MKHCKKQNTEQQIQVGVYAKKAPETNPEAEQCPKDIETRIFNKMRF